MRTKHHEENLKGLRDLRVLRGLDLFDFDLTHVVTGLEPALGN